MLNNKGSLILSNLFTVAGGIVFTLLFINLTKYLTADSALEQAITKASRCLTPTDAECIS